MAVGIIREGMLSEKIMSAVILSGEINFTPFFRMLPLMVIIKLTKNYLMPVIFKKSRNGGKDMVAAIKKIYMFQQQQLAEKPILNYMEKTTLSKSLLI